MPSTDFDFLKGRFRVQNRRLKARLVACEEWIEFELDFWGQPVMGGTAFMDQTSGVLGGQAFWGMTLRLRDPDRDEWSLFWSDTSQPGLLPPTIGRFEDGVGVFYGDDHEGGVPVRVRFRWTGITATSAHWEQAFSTDGGESWETNWTMAFEKISDEETPS